MLLGLGLSATIRLRALALGLRACGGLEFRASGFWGLTAEGLSVSWFRSHGADGMGLVP